ncbi:BioA Adenosylmethionine-8-amino-7-oxononanoate aminotransferase [Pyrenophora tritici-repentis]|nr:Aminotransferase class-III [Pyrenophora tritici-repentis]KAI2475519.1 BioA Adenosylmethionine-8-amino-7-oxononanoate aminotransferase [Pyrenophora tritici-repentis]
MKAGENVGQAPARQLQELVLQEGADTVAASYSNQYKMMVAPSTCTTTSPRSQNRFAPTLRVLNSIERENLIKLCAKGGKEFLEILKSELEGLPTVQQIRGTGVMVELDLISDIATQIEQKVLLE